MSSPDRRAKISAAAPRRRGLNRVVVATVVAVLVIAAAVTAVVVGAQRSSDASTAGGSSLPTGAAGTGQGIVVNPGAPQGAPVLDLYEDFQCPVCKRFEALFGEQLTTLAAEGKVRLVVHPLSFLDDNLGNDSSNRAANAAACAADQGKYLEFHAATFAGQPVKEGDGYTDADLKGFAQAAGLTGAALDTWQKCYDDRAHNQWVESVQTQSEKDGVNGTPTVKLNGKVVDLSGLTRDKLAAEVKAATK